MKKYDSLDIVYLQDGGDLQSLQKNAYFLKESMVINFFV